MKNHIRKLLISAFCISVLIGAYNISGTEAARKKYHKAGWAYNALGWKVMGAHYYVEGDPVTNKVFAQYEENWSNWPNYFTGVRYSAYVYQGRNYTKMHFTINGGIKIGGFEGILKSESHYLPIDF